MALYGADSCDGEGVTSNGRPSTSASAVFSQSSDVRSSRASSRQTRRAARANAPTWDTRLDMCGATSFTPRGETLPRLDPRLLLDKSAVATVSARCALARCDQDGGIPTLGRCQSPPAPSDATPSPEAAQSARFGHLETGT
ncbi:hypothetical protein PHYPSEUDO_001608 [Phytophthora pseudosyringae]|uniref:Uncharacterized protein n=1 Tax=Phytophthora pseudosyringae TaxID=221518 RepID=A0A8T1V349_9STRA|nr:hypothetical protein PHYPSEUDO_001608 [Phytophthora pseudosyringae]